MTNLDSILKSRDITLTNKGSYSQSYGFFSSHVWMWELDNKKDWVWRIDAFKLWCWKEVLRSGAFPRKHTQGFSCLFATQWEGLPREVTVELQLEEEPIPGKDDGGLWREVTEGDACWEQTARDRGLCMRGDCRDRQRPDDARPRRLWEELGSSSRHHQGAFKGF